MSTSVEMMTPVATNAAARRLRTTMAAVRLSFVWFGVRKSLSPQQKEEAADSFGAEGSYLSAAKKLLDTKHPAFKAVTAVRGRAVSLWKGLSLPFPESGIRLIRQDDVPVFDVQLTSIRAELNEELLEQFHGTVSLPFEAGESECIAVKIVDDRGIESLKVIRLDQV